ncbi:9089_t:CDS:2 [Acaulospora colombiana]|uniref:9089_t:CDS:1 n=1 Tax=Acaulospora colombiana TaxID=27376 RepID=A0ACA9LS34_9GLOM|nr:9089_t:CDS:2 [Acaulospora colombiana]
MRQVFNSVSNSSSTRAQTEQQSTLSKQEAQILYELQALLHVVDSMLITEAYLKHRNAPEKAWMNSRDLWRKKTLNDELEGLVIVLAAPLIESIDLQLGVSNNIINPSASGMEC